MREREGSRWQNGRRKRVYLPQTFSPVMGGRFWEEHRKVLEDEHAELMVPPDSSGPFCQEWPPGQGNHWAGRRQANTA